MSQDTRKDKRAKVVSLNVRYKSATIDEFIENHSHDVSRGGVFVKTQTPFAPGTLLKFEIRLAGDQAVIAGVGRVVWKREPTQAGGSERPAGMGVKFIKVDDSSRIVIDKLAGTKADAGSAYLSEPEGTFESEAAPLSIKPAAPAAPAAPAPIVRPPIIGAGVPKIPAATPAIPAVTPKAGVPAPAKPIGGLNIPRGPGPAAPPAPTPAVPAVAAKAPAEKLPATTPPKAAAPPPRKMTMMGLGSVNAPPRVGAPPAPTPPAPPPTQPAGSHGIESLSAPIIPAPTPPPATAAVAPPRMASGAGMFPKPLPRNEEEPPKEATVMKQAAELLEEALREAGGSLDEIGDNPLFTGGPAQNKEQPVAPLIPEGELPASTDTGTLIMGSPAVASIPPEMLMDHPPAPTPAAGAPPQQTSASSAGATQQMTAAPVPPASRPSQPEPSQTATTTPAFAAPAPETARAQVQSVPPGEKKSGAGVWIALVLILLFIGGGGFAAFKMGLLAGVIGPSVTPSAQPSATQSAPPPSASVSATPPVAVMTDASTENAAVMDSGAKAADASTTKDAASAATTATATATATQAPTATAAPTQQSVWHPRPRPTATATATATDTGEPLAPNPTATATATATDTATAAPTTTSAPTTTATTAPKSSAVDDLH